MIDVVTRVLDLHERIDSWDLADAARASELAKLLGAPGAAHEQQQRPAAELHAEREAGAAVGDQGGDGHARPVVKLTAAHGDAWEPSAVIARTIAS